MLLVDWFSKSIVLQSQLETYASNASNITTGVLKVSCGGTGRTDGKVTDIYINTPHYQGSAEAKGIFHAKRIYSSDNLNTFKEDGNGFFFKPNSQDASVMLSNNYPVSTATGVLKTYQNPTTDAYNSYQEFITLGFHSTRAMNGEDSWGEWRIDNFSANGQINIFISQSGNDANCGFYPDYPIKTLDKLLLMLNNIKTKYINLFFGSGEWGDFTISGTRCHCERLGIYGYNFTDKQEYTDRANVDSLPYFTFIELRNLYYHINGQKIDKLRILDSFGYIVGSALHIGNLTLMNSFCESNNSGGGFTIYDGGTTETKISLSKGSTLNNYNNLWNTDTGEHSDYFLWMEPNCRLDFNTTKITGGDLYTKPQRYQSNRRVYGFIIGITKIPGTYTLDEWMGLNNGYLNLYPTSSNNYSIGQSNLLWKQVYANNGTIQTSDEREKSNITSIPEEVLQAWGEVQFSQFQFNDAVAEKGSDNARLHSGVIAQRVKAIFESHGLDATRYGLLCYDSWEAKDYDEVVSEEPAVYETVEVVDKEGTDTEAPVTHFEERLVTPAKPIIKHHHEDSGDRYAIRYDECLCMEAAYQRYRTNKLEERIAALEAKIK